MQVVLNNWFTFSSPGAVSCQFRREPLRNTPVLLEVRIIRTKTVEGLTGPGTGKKWKPSEKKNMFFPHFFWKLLLKRCSMVEGTDTGWLAVLEKKGRHQAAGIIENYGIDSETDVSLLDQGDLRNLVSQAHATEEARALVWRCASTCREDVAFVFK